jgi:hypothetical protein
MISKEIRVKLNFPSFGTTQDDLMAIAERVIIPDIQRGIHSSIAINGGALPANDPQTVKRKGHNHPLIETGTLVKSFHARRSGQNKVIIFIDPERRDIARHLQIEGIETKRGLKFYRFFGISADAHEGAMEYMRNRIKSAIQDARGTQNA